MKTQKAWLIKKGNSIVKYKVVSEFDKDKIQKNILKQEIKVGLFLKAEVFIETCS